MDLLTKISFGCILLPIVYMIGFLQRENTENVYKTLNIILYIVGHLFNMIILSVVGFITSDGKITDRANTLILIFGMINPFTYNFFNATLDHFISPIFADEIHSV